MGEEDAQLKHDTEEACLITETEAQERGDEDAHMKASGEEARLQAEDDSRKKAEEEARENAAVKAKDGATEQDSKEGSVNGYFDAQKQGPASETREATSLDSKDESKEEAGSDIPVGNEDSRVKVLEAERLVEEAEDQCRIELEKADVSTDSDCLVGSEEDIETEGNPPSTLEGSLGREAASSKLDGGKIHSLSEVASTDSDHPLVSNLEGEHDSDAEELTLPSVECRAGRAAAVKHTDERTKKKPGSKLMARNLDKNQRASALASG